jgi:transcriptional regulator with GAF, ATPase, and Fis domain
MMFLLLIKKVYPSNQEGINHARSEDAGIAGPCPAPGEKQTDFCTFSVLWKRFFCSIFRLCANLFHGTENRREAKLSGGKMEADARGPVNVKVDEKDFFREATLKLCSSLEIERALHQCLLYVRRFIPAGQAGFHVYHRHEGIVETVAHATPAGGQATSMRIPLSARGRRQIEKQRLVRVRLIDLLGNDPITGPVADRLKAWDLSAVVIDLVLEKTMLGVFSVFNNGSEQFSAEHVRLLSLLDKPCAIALTNSLRFRELKNLKELLADDNRYLKEELNKMVGEQVIGAGQGLKEAMEMVRQVAPLESPVLLLGETGTGKEVMANAIHNLSLRKEGPFIRVNCGAIPASLLDSELFGYEKGAFTGAVSRKRGRIERAQGGTLFLDEIGELSSQAQVRSVS